MEADDLNRMRMAAEAAFDDSGSINGGSAVDCDLFSMGGAKIEILKDLKVLVSKWGVGLAWDETVGGGDTISIASNLMDVLYIEHEGVDTIRKVAVCVDNLTLTEKRAAAEAAFDDSCTINSPSRADDSEGGAVLTWPQVATGVSCDLFSMSGRESMVADAPVAVGKWGVGLEWDRAIEPDYQIVIGTLTLQVIYVKSEGVDTIRKVAICNEVQ